MNNAMEEVVEEEDWEERVAMLGGPSTPQPLSVESPSSSSSSTWACKIIHFSRQRNVVNKKVIIWILLVLVAAASFLGYFLVGSSSSSLPPSHFDDGNLIKHFQIQNYLNNNNSSNNNITKKTLILNIHITHHAGTTLCQVLSAWGPTPEFACMDGDNWDNHTDIKAIPKHPWNYNDTRHSVDIISQYFHAISWEFGFFPKGPSYLNDTNWEYEHLVSIYISRHPMDRLLAGDGVIDRLYGKDLVDRTEEQWWDYVQHPYTNNFALDRLTKSKDGNCVNASNTPIECLERGKELLSRFTIILDQQCLSEGIVALATLLKKPIPPQHGNKRIGVNATPSSSMGKSAKERINNDGVYYALLERNIMDIALYEWSKNISLVRCDDL